MTLDVHSSCSLACDSAQMIQLGLHAIEQGIQLLHEGVDGQLCGPAISKDLFVRIRNVKRRFQEEMCLAGAHQQGAKRDFTQVLPPEVVWQVFGLLGQRELVRAAQVSHAWNHYVIYLSSYLTSPVFRSDLSFRHVDRFFRLCARTRTNRIRALRLVFQFEQELDMLHAFALSNMAVDSLTVSLSNEVLLEAMVAKTHNSLYHFCSRLSSLTLALGCVKSCSVLDRLLAHFTHLKHLCLSVQGLAYNLDTDGCGKNVFGALKSLSIGFFYYQQSPTSAQFMGNLLRHNSFPVLETLELDKCPILPSDMSKLLSPRLSTFKVKNLPFVDTRDLVAAFQGTSCHLDEFSLCDETKCRDWMAPKMPKLSCEFLSTLRHLELRSTNLSTSDLIRVLRETQGNLTGLVLSCNRNIDFSDALCFSSLLQLCPRLLSATFNNAANFNDESCQNLCAAAHEIPLQSLEISNTQISSEGIECLLFSGQLGRLRRLGVQKCGICTDYIDSLNKYSGCSVLG